MANNFPKEVQVAFEEAVEGFDSDNIVANRSTVRQSGGGQAFRDNFIEWLPVEMIGITETGLDITSSMTKDVTQLSVPHNTNIVKNASPFTLTAKEQKDPQGAAKKIAAGVTAISAAVNRTVANMVQIEGAQVVTKATQLNAYADVANVEALLISQDVSQTTAKTMALNASDYSYMAGNLAERANMGDKVTGAFEKSFLGDVAGFNTHRTSFAPVQTAAGGGGSITVNGAQSYVPVSSTVDSLGNPTNVDNRSMNLTVSSTTSVVAGDKFTIATVNALSLINKNDTGELRTFTVKSVVSGTVLEISPPIVQGSSTQAEAEYANCTVEAPNSGAIVWLNATQALSNVFWEEDSVILNAGTLDIDDAGLDLMRMRTDSGIEIIMAKQSAIGTLTTGYRLTAFYGSTLNDPMKAGVLLGNQ